MLQAAALVSLVLVMLGLALIDAPVSAGFALLLCGCILSVAVLHFALEQVPAAVPSGRHAHTAAGGGSDLEHLLDMRWQISDNEARLRSLLDTQHALILRRDADGYVVFANLTFCRLFATTPAQIQGQLFAPEILDGGSPFEPAGQDGTRQSRQCISQMQTSTGSRWIAWDEQTVSGATGLEIQSVGRDITSERQAEQALKDARDQAEAANRAKSRFLAAMSHEIRTPMNGILGMSSLLSDTAQTSEQQTFTAAIDQSARALLALIDEILDFSKIEAGKLELMPVPFSLQRCIQGAIELLAPRACEKGLELACVFEASVPALVVGDEARVRQIVLNLVSNAIKFTDKGGVRILVAAGGAGGPNLEIEIKVEDTGIGLSREDMKRLFDEFEQSESALHRRQGGTGLGLAISKRLARAMGGDISAEGQPGKGAVFTTRLRLGRAPTAPAEIFDHPKFSGARILLAFDRVFERSAMATLLEGAGAAVVETTLADALAALDTSNFGARAFTHVIVDAEADLARCTALLQKARLQSPSGDTAGIVLITVLARAGLHKLKAAGYESYLVRPVRPESLLQQVARTARASREPAAGETGKSARARGHGGPPRVLVAEDNEINALLARRVIEKAGCIPVLATNGQAAVDAVRASMEAGNEPFDLVLMDVFMPGLDGLAATRAIRALTSEAAGTDVRSLPVVALTANAFAEDRERCLAAGMNDYLAKPFDTGQLSDLLSRWVGFTAAGDPVAGEQQPPAA